MTVTKTIVSTRTYKDGKLTSRKVEVSRHDDRSEDLDPRPKVKVAGLTHEGGTNEPSGS